MPVYTADDVFSDVERTADSCLTFEEVDETLQQTATREAPFLHPHGNPLNTVLGLQTAVSCVLPVKGGAITGLPTLFTGEHDKLSITQLKIKGLAALAFNSKNTTPPEQKGWKDHPDFPLVNSISQLKENIKKILNRAYPNLVREVKAAHSVKTFPNGLCITSCTLLVNTNKLPAFIKTAFVRDTALVLPMVDGTGRLVMATPAYSFNPPTTQATDCSLQASFFLEGELPAPSLLSHLDINRVDLSSTAKKAQYVQSAPRRP